MKSNTGTGEGDDSDTEDNRRAPAFPTPLSNDEMQHIKDNTMQEAQYNALERAYKKLWGYPDRIVPNTDAEGVPFLVEENFTQNISEVIGCECEFFGKMLYLYMAHGKDKQRIYMPRFFSSLQPFCNDDEKMRHNRTAFAIMDIDGDQLLNVVNLLHLHKNVPTNTEFGQEIFTAIEFFITKEITKKSMLKDTKVDLELYLKIFKHKMCLTREIRTCFLGYPVQQRKPEGGIEIIQPLLPWL